jgi:hypothetical protein
MVQSGGSNPTMGAMLINNATATNDHRRDAEGVWTRDGSLKNSAVSDINGSGAKLSAITAKIG